MKRVHLLRTELAAEVFAELFVAIQEAGLRAGWLDLNPASEASPDPTLDSAAAQARSERSALVRHGL